MKPIIIVLRGTMTPEAIKALNENDLCVVESDDPAKVQFLDPIPAAGARTEIENAAIELSRKVLAPDFWTGGAEGTGRMACARAYLDILVRGTRLDPLPSQAEVEKRHYNDARTDELRKIAREEARAEHAAKAAAKAKTKPPA